MFVLLIILILALFLSTVIFQVGFMAGRQMEASRWKGHVCNPIDEEKDE